MRTLFDFSSYIAEHTRDFTGREWVFAEIDRWLADANAHRIFLLTGEPGVGKTAFAARLTQFSDGIVTPPAHCVRLGNGFLSAVHFCSARYGGWISPDSLTRSLSAQLAMHYQAFAEALASDPRIHVEQHVGTNLGAVIGAQINNYYAEAPEALFNSLVRLPLQALFQQGEPPEALVILVDGLDEALNYSGRPSIVHLLAACCDLPPQVRLLLTSRPVFGVTEPFRPLEPFTLFAHTEDNQCDLRAYIQGRFGASPLLRAAAGSEAGVARTVESLVRRSSGNFLVVSKVLDAVERDELNLDDPERLPADLQSLYTWFLYRLTRGDVAIWREHYRPVVGILAVVQEPVDAPTLCQWTGSTLQQVTDTLHDLQEFLRPAQSDRQRLYHESFVDFLISAEAGSYHLDAAEYHRRIADYYRGEAPTWDEADWSRVDDYGKRYLAAHLHALKDCEALHTLVESQAWTAAKYVDTPWVGSLIQDLQLASAVVTGGDVEGWVRAMGHQLRRALIDEMMSHVSDRAILFLARLGQIDRALDLAKRQWDKFKSLCEIVRILAPTEPAKAVEILTELAHLADDGSALERCKARLVAAQEILRLVPASSHVALDFVKEAEGLRQEIPAPDLVKYQVVWYLPTLALSGDLDAALEASEPLPLLQRAQTLRHISSMLPEDHPSKKCLAEQALSTLNNLEQTPETQAEKIRAIVALLPLVYIGKRKRLLNLLESVGASLRSIEAPVEYAVMPHWAIERVAAVDLDWARRMLLESNWGSTPDTLYEVAREMAKDDYEEALRLVREQFSNHILTPHLLIHIIGVVASEDISKAEALIEEYTQYLRGSKSDAYIAVAEAYLARGDVREAQNIFERHAVFADSEGLMHAREDLQVAILARSGFLPVEAARDRLMQFSTCPRCHTSREQEAGIILARIAARQNRIDFLEQYRFSRDAKLKAASDLADYVSPEAARQYLESQHVGTCSSKEAEEVYAHITAVEAQQDRTKLDVLLKHFDDNGRPHHFCDYMLELPHALRKLVETERIEPAEAMAIINQLCPLLVDWQCPRRDQPPEHDSWRTRCACYGQSEHVLAQLIGITARLAPDRSEEMMSSLPAQPIRVYALEQILCHTQANEDLVQRVIKTSQECIEDPWQRAEAYYTVATLLPAEMSGMIKSLIELAEPLLDETPTDYHTNRYGIPIRIGPSSTSLKIYKARALMKLVRDVSQFAYVREGLKAIEGLVQLDDKLRVFDFLGRQATKWSREDRLALLWHIWEVSTTRRLEDVEAFIAFLVPIVYSLGGEAAFWRLYDCVERAYQGLPRVD